MASDSSHPAHASVPPLAVDAPPSPSSFDPILNKLRTQLGRVIQGMEYVDAIHRGEPPADPSRILHAYIAADNPPPYSAAPPAPVAKPDLGPAVTLPGTTPAPATTPHQ